MATRSAMGRSVMAYSDSISRGETARVVHPKLDPKRPNRDGRIVRESRDNEEHPNSVPVAVIFDTTGSMGHIPALCVEKLGALMDLISERKYLADPQVLFGAVNDSTTADVAALEVGQFESGNQMDDALTNIFSGQSGGGGSSEESYELAMYFFAKKTELDSLIKRNKKGYLFFIGDETPYPYVDKDEVKTWIGDTIQDDIPTEQILTELKEKFEVFWLFPGDASNSGNERIQNRLKQLFGQRFLKMPSSADVCPTIAAAIAINEGRKPKEVAAELKVALGKAAVDNVIAEIVDSIPPRHLDLDL